MPMIQLPLIVLQKMLVLLLERLGQERHEDSKLEGLRIATAEHLDNLAGTLHEYIKAIEAKGSKDDDDNLSGGLV